MIFVLALNFFIDFFFLSGPDPFFSFLPGPDLQIVIKTWQSLQRILGGGIGQHLKGKHAGNPLCASGSWL